jgi:hypothetical protein
MALRFARLVRASIRRLLPGQKLAEHGIMAERLADAICAIASMSWSTAGAFTG